MMNNRQAGHPPSPADSIEQQFDEKLNSRRERILERRKSADLRTIQVCVDGESCESQALGDSHTRIQIDGQTRLIEVFSGGERPIPLANLLFSPETIKHSRFRRILARPSYSVVLDGGITVKFTIQAAPPTTGRLSYSIDIRIVDDRLHQPQGLLAWAKAQTSAWGAREWAEAVLIPLVLLGVVIGGWMMRSSPKPPDVPGRDQTADNEPAPEPVPLPGTDRTFPNRGPALTPPQPHGTPGGEKSKEIAAVTVHLSFRDRPRSASSSTADLDAPVRLSRAYNRIVITLPEGSIKGSYIVSIEDPFRKPVTPPIRARSADGKMLVVRADLRRLSETEYRICVVSSARVGDEAPVCREVIVRRAASKP